jgi:hypothetical protein
MALDSRVILVVNNLPLNDVILSFVDENEGIAIVSSLISSPYLMFDLFVLAAQHCLRQLTISIKYPFV